MKERYPDQPWHEIVGIPALLRHARATYGSAMRAALAAIGCDDMPKNGMYVVGGLAMEAGGIPLLQLLKELRISKQSQGQLVDTLVLHGYLDRSADPEDQGKTSITLTSRGRAAAAVQTAARERVDIELAGCVGAECVAQMRKGLGALCALGHDENTDD